MASDLGGVSAVAAGAPAAAGAASRESDGGEEQAQLATAPARAVAASTGEQDGAEVRVQLATATVPTATESSGLAVVVCPLPSEGGPRTSGAGRLTHARAPSVGLRVGRLTPARAPSVGLSTQQDSGTLSGSCSNLGPAACTEGCGGQEQLATVPALAAPAAQGDGANGFERVQMAAAPAPSTRPSPAPACMVGGELALVGCTSRATVQANDGGALGGPARLAVGLALAVASTPVPTEVIGEGTTAGDGAPSTVVLSVSRAAAAAISSSVHMDGGLPIDSDGTPSAILGDSFESRLARLRRAVRVAGLPEKVQDVPQDAQSFFAAISLAMFDVRQHRAAPCVATAGLLRLRAERLRARVVAFLRDQFAMEGERAHVEPGVCPGYEFDGRSYAEQYLTHVARLGTPADTACMLGAQIHLRIRLRFVGVNTGSRDFRRPLWIPHSHWNEWPVVVLGYLVEVVEGRSRSHFVYCGAAGSLDGMESPPGFVACQCQRLHSDLRCNALTDHSSNLCQKCREDGSSDGEMCNCLCEGCDPPPPPSPAPLRKEALESDPQRRLRLRVRTAEGRAATAAVDTARGGSSLSDVDLRVAVAASLRTEELVAQADADACAAVAASLLLPEADRVLAEEAQVRAAVAESLQATATHGPVLDGPQRQDASSALVARSESYAAVATSLLLPESSRALEEEAQVRAAVAASLQASATRWPDLSAPQGQDVLADATDHGVHTRRMAEKHCAAARAALSNGRSAQAALRYAFAIEYLLTSPSEELRVLEWAAKELWMLAQSEGHSADWSPPFLQRVADALQGAAQRLSLHPCDEWCHPDAEALDALRLRHDTASPRVNADRLVELNAVAGAEHPPRVAWDVAPDGRCLFASLFLGLRDVSGVVPAVWELARGVNSLTVEDEICLEADALRALAVTRIELMSVSCDSVAAWVAVADFPGCAATSGEERLKAYLLHAARAYTAADELMIMAVQLACSCRFRFVYSRGFGVAEVRPAWVSTTVWLAWPEIVVGFLGDVVGNGLADGHFVYLAVRGAGGVTSDLQVTSDLIPDSSDSEAQHVLRTDGAISHDSLERDMLAEIVAIDTEAPNLISPDDATSVSDGSTAPESRLHYVTGDATTVSQGRGFKVIAHVCNDLGRWGKGFVMAISAKWPEVAKEYRRWHQSGDDGFRLGAVQTVIITEQMCANGTAQAALTNASGGLAVANMIGQHGIKTESGEPPVRYNAIGESLLTVGARAVELAGLYRTPSVHMPRIGAGLAGGQWTEIEPLILRMLTASPNLEAYVYDLEVRDVSYEATRKREEMRQEQNSVHTTLERPRMDPDVGEAAAVKADSLETGTRAGGSAQRGGRGAGRGRGSVLSRLGCLSVIAPTVEESALEDGANDPVQVNPVTAVTNEAAVDQTAMKRQEACTLECPYPKVRATLRRTAGHELEERCMRCGSNSNLLRYGEGVYLCNNITPLSDTSCVVQHVTECEQPLLLQMLPDSHWTSAELRCCVSGSTDVRALVLAEHGAHHASIVRQELVVPGATVHSIVDGHVLAPWISESQLLTDVDSMAAQSRARRRSNGATSFAPPVKFADVSEYFKHFTEVLAMVGRHENLANAARARSAVTVSWRPGLQGPIACFAADISEREGLRLDETVRLTRPSTGDDSEEWLSVGVVTRTKGSEVEVTLQECVGGLSSIESSVVTGYTLLPVCSMIAVERLQTALGLFAHDEVTGCSFRVQQCLLGNPVPSPVCRLIEVQPHPGLPRPNASQIEAIKGSLLQALWRVVGPPGTGKTTTLLQTMHALLLQGGGQVLVCAPSNAACNHLASGLSGLNITCIRYYAASHADAAGLQLDGALRLHSHLDPAGAFLKYQKLEAALGVLTHQDKLAYRKAQRVETIEALRSVRVVICTCASAASTIIASLRFNSVIIDEAGQCTEMDALCPIVLGAQHVTLCGDDKQLGPVVGSPRAKEAGFEISMFSRLAKCRTPAVMLNVQHRMHPAISAFISSEFYAGAVTDAVSTAGLARVDVTFPWPCADKPIFFLHKKPLEGELKGGRGGKSTYNPLEADAVADCVLSLIRQGAAASEIGVISMYDAQRAAILDRLASLAETSVVVANVDAYQGQERPFIVLSLARSNVGGSIGHVGDARRINVALSRAKSGLIIVGDALTVCKHSHIWQRCLSRLAADRLVVTGSTVAPWQVFESAVFGTGDTAAVLSAFQESGTEPTACVDSWHTVTLPVPVAHLPDKERRQLQRRGVYSRFICKAPVQPARLQEFREKLLMVGRPVASEQASLLTWPLSTTVAEVSDTLDPFSQFMLAGTRMPFRHSLISWFVQHHGRQCESEVVRALVYESFPEVCALGLDPITGRGVETEPLDTRGFQLLKQHFPHVDCFLCGGGGSDALFETEESMRLEATFAAGVDLFQPQARTGMINLLHSASDSVTAYLVAEKELINTTLKQLTTAAEGILRLFQFWWRACIVGRMDRGQRIEYWQLVHSSKLEAPERLREHIKSCRLRAGQGHDVQRWFTWRDGKVVKVSEPIGSRVTRYQRQDGDRIVFVTHGVDTTTVRRIIEYHRATQARPGHEVTVATLYSTTKEVYIKGVAVSVDRRRRAGPLRSANVALRFLHRFRPVRAMQCGYGGAACLHTVRDAEGEAVLDAAGEVVREREAATKADWNSCQVGTSVVTIWYVWEAEALQSRCPGHCLLLPYNEPGGLGEAARQLGFNAVITDLKVTDSKPWFEKKAQQLYGSLGASVAVQQGDIFSPAVRAAAKTFHPTARDIWGMYPTPACVRGSTIVELRGTSDARAQPGDRPPARGDFGEKGARNETLSAEVNYCKQQFQEHKIVSLCETTSGTPFQAPAGVACTEFDELAYACQIQGKHKVFSSDRHKIHMDKILLANGKWLSEHTCPGAARPLQPRQTAGGAPIHPPCCTGQRACGHNNGYFVYNKEALAAINGTHPSHISTKTGHNNLLPVAIGKHQIAQLACHSLNVRFGVPFVTHDAGCCDLRLAAWRIGLIDILRDSAQALPPLPILRVVLICTPLNLPDTIVVNSQGELPAFTLQAGGFFTEEVADAFGRTYDGLRIFKERISFVCDFLSAVPNTPVAVFHSSAVACNDAYFMQPWSRSAMLPQKQAEGAGTRLFTSTIAHLQSRLADNMAKQWPKLQCSALSIATTAELCKAPMECTLTPYVACTPGLLERAHAFLTTGVMEGVSQSGPAVAVRDASRDGGRTTRKPDAAEVASVMALKLSASYDPFTGRQVTAFSGEAADEGALGVQATDAAAKVLRVKYIAEREKLMGKVDPAVYGLDGTAERLDAGSPRPGHNVVEAVGFALVWRQRLVTIAHNSRLCCIFHKALVARPPEEQSRMLEMRALFLSVFGAHAFADKVDQLLTSAMVNTEPLQTGWVIAARDSTGRLPSRMIRPLKVSLSIWKVTLADECEWTTLTSARSGKVAAGAWQLHVPVFADGEFTMANAVEGSGPFGDTRAACQEPCKDDSLTRSIGQLHLQTLQQFADGYRALHLDRIFPRVASFFAHNALEASSLVAWPSTPYRGEDNWPALCTIRDECVEAGDTLQGLLDLEMNDALREEISCQRATLEQLENQVSLLGMAAALNTLERTHRIPRDSISRLNILELWCSGNVVSDVLKGLKTIESRLATSMYLAVAAGWLLCLRDGDTGYCVWALVVEQFRYSSFTELVHTHGEAVLPGVDVHNMTDAQIESYFYLLHRGGEARQLDNRVRQWRAATSQVGCVVCWRIVALPTYSAICPPRRFGSLLTLAGRVQPRMTLRAFARRARPALRLRSLEVLARRESWRRLAQVAVARAIRTLTMALWESRQRRMASCHWIARFSREGGLITEGVNTKPKPAADGSTEREASAACVQETPVGSPHEIPQILEQLAVAEVEDGSNEPAKHSKAQKRRQHKHNKAQRALRAKFEGRHPTQKLERAADESTDNKWINPCNWINTHVSAAGILHGVLVHPKGGDLQSPILTEENLINDLIGDLGLEQTVVKLREQAKALASGPTAALGTGDQPQVARLRFVVNTNGKLRCMIRARGRLEHVTCADGIAHQDIGDRFTHICKPTACTGADLPLVVATGASSANSETSRLPGTVRVMPRDEQTAGRKAAKVLNLYTQLGPRAEAQQSHLNNKGQPPDSLSQRIRWFRACLLELGCILPRGAVMAFPWRAGCHGDNGIWELWKHELRVFAAEHPELHVVIVQRSQDVVPAMIERRLAESSKAEKQARAVINAEGGSEETRRLGHLVIDALQAQVEESCGPAVESHKPPGLQAAVSNLCGDEVQAQAKARADVRVQNQAYDELFRAQNIKDLREGETSSADVLAAQNTPAGQYGNNIVVRSGTERDRRVVIVGLETTTGYNGMTGITDGLTKTGRVVVVLDAGQPNQPVGPQGQMLKSINVHHDNLTDQVAAEAFAGEAVQATPASREGYPCV